MRYCLIIGINSYTHGISPLRCARNDALALGKIFAQNGYTVDSLLDNEASATNIRRKLREIGSSLKAGDHFVFYFSGHGCEINGNHHLIGQPAYPDGIKDGEETVRLDRVRELTDVPDVRRFFMLDCCRNSITEGKGFDDFFAEKGVTLKTLAEARSANAGVIQPLIVTSCSVGEKSYEDERSGRGFFTQVIENTLNDATIKSFRMFRRALVDGMNGLKKTIPGRQTLCWYGDVDNWDQVKLFQAWQESIQTPVQTPDKVQVQTQTPVKTPKPAPAPAPKNNDNEPLSLDERVQFGDTFLSLEDLIAKTEASPLPDLLKEKLEPLKKRFQALSEKKQTKSALKELLETEKEIRALNILITVWHDCQKKTEDIRKKKQILTQHQCPLNANISSLERRIAFSQKNDDFEAELRFLKEVDSLLGAQVATLKKQKKRISDLRSEFETIKSALIKNGFVLSEDESAAFLRFGEFADKFDYDGAEKCMLDLLKTLNSKKSKYETTKKDYTQMLSKIKDTISAKRIIPSKKISDLMESAEKHAAANDFSAAFPFLYEAKTKLAQLVKMKNNIQSLKDEYIHYKRGESALQEAEEAEKAGDYAAALKRLKDEAVKAQQNANDLKAQCNALFKNNFWKWYFTGDSEDNNYEKVDTTDLTLIFNNEHLLQRYFNWLKVKICTEKLYWLLFSGYFLLIVILMLSTDIIILREADHVILCSVLFFFLFQFISACFCGAGVLRSLLAGCINAILFVVLGSIMVDRSSFDIFDIIHTLFVSIGISTIGYFPVLYPIISYIVPIPGIIFKWIWDKKSGGQLKIHSYMLYFEPPIDL